MKIFKRIDFLFFIYLLLSTIFLSLAWNKAIHTLMFIYVRIFIMIFVPVLLYLYQKYRGQLLTFLRYTYPIIFSGYFYTETVFYNKIFFNNLDQILVSIEQKIFGFQPSMLFCEYFSSKLFSEVMYFGYFSFYLIIIGYILFLFAYKQENFVKDTFILCSSLYIYYTIFIFFPSAGPQFYFSYPENVLPDAYVFNHVMHFIQRVGEQPTGAFPSSHVGISIIILMLSKNRLPLFFRYAWPLVVVLIFSTVYIKAHYVIDVLGGFITAPLIYFISNYIFHLTFIKTKGVS